MNHITLRVATLEDLPILYSFEQGIITVERPYDPTLADDPINYYDIKAMILSEEVEVIVALFQEDIVGSAYAKIKKAQPYLKFNSYAYLGFMYVRPEYRGRGISRLVIDRLTDWARSQNLTELRLEVYAENSSAIKAYEKAGMTKNMIEMRMAIKP